MIVAGEASGDMHAAEGQLYFGSGYFSISKFAEAKLKAQPIGEHIATVGGVS